MCMIVHAQVHGRGAPNARGRDRATLVPQAVCTGSVLPSTALKAKLACSFLCVKSDRDVTWDSSHSHLSSKPNCLQNAQAGSGRGWPVFCFQNGKDSEQVGLRHIHAHTPGGRRTIQSENSMQIC